MATIDRSIPTETGLIISFPKILFRELDQSKQTSLMSTGKRSCLLRLTCGRIITRPRALVICPDFLHRYTVMQMHAVHSVHAAYAAMYPLRQSRLHTMTPQSIVLLLILRPTI